jgi:hypothetical protein
MFFSVMLLFEFRRHTPKSEAYLWVRDNLPDITTKLTITEEGLDPMNKASFSKVIVYK